MEKHYEERPTRSGSYFASVTIPAPNGEFKFRYVAYYDVETYKWHKYDPFEEDGCNILEEIEGNVEKWAEDVPAFL